MQLPLGQVVQFFGTNVTINRNGAVTYDANGLPVEASPETVSIVASIQPLAGRERRALPEAFRDREVVTVYSDCALRTGGETGGAAPDRFTWQGRTYEVFGASDWEPAAQHFKSLAALKDRP